MPTKPSWMSENIWEMLPAFPFEFPMPWGILPLPRGVLKKWSTAGGAQPPEALAPAPIMTTTPTTTESDIRINNLTVYPTTVVSGGKVTVTFWAGNYGGTAGAEDVLGQRISLQPGESNWYQFDITTSQLGTFTLSADSQSVRYSVTTAGATTGGTGAPISTTVTPPPSGAPAPAAPIISTPTGPVAPIISTPTGPVDLDKIEILDINSQTPVLQSVDTFSFDFGPATKTYNLALAIPLKTTDIYVRWRNKGIVLSDPDTDYFEIQFGGFVPVSNILQTPPASIALYAWGGPGRPELLSGSFTYKVPASVMPGIGKVATWKMTVMNVASAPGYTVAVGGMADQVSGGDTVWRGNFMIKNFWQT